MQPVPQGPQMPRRGRKLVGAAVAAPLMAMTAQISGRRMREEMGMGLAKDRERTTCRGSGPGQECSELIRKCPGSP